MASYACSQPWQTDSELILVKHHFRSFLKYIAEISQFPTEKVRTLSYIKSGISHPNFNHIFGDVGDIDVSEFYTLIYSLRQPTIWTLGENHKKLEEILEEKCNFSYIDIHCLVFDMKKYIEKPKKKSSFEMVRITQIGLFDLWDELSTQIFDHERDMAKKFYRGFLKSRFHDTKLQFYIAFLEMLPVGICCLYNDNNILSNYWSGVVPTARNKGIATQMAKFRLSQAKSLGSEKVIVHCNEQSLQMYKKLGFYNVGHKKLYFCEPKKQ